VRKEVPFSEVELDKLAQLFQLDEDNLLIDFHDWLVEIIGQDLLKIPIDDVEKERHVIYRKLEHQGARRLHSLFEREIVKVLKKQNK
jgi:hypothetical protein